MRWVVAGDFNWVTSPADRLDMRGGSETGAADIRDEAHWQDIIQHTCNMLELAQPGFTYYGSLAKSRLDRAYTNHHPADWFRMSFNAAVLPKQ
jgi:hypothetical protein